MPNFEREYPVNTTVSLPHARAYLRRENIRYQGIERRIPRRRNFSIAIDARGYGHTITLKRNADGHEKVLNDFLPEGAFFAYGHWMYSLSRRAVGYDGTRQLEGTGHILNLGHEIGHGVFHIAIGAQVGSNPETDDPLTTVYDMLGRLSPDSPLDDFTYTFSFLDEFDEHHHLQNWETLLQQESGNGLAPWMMEALEQHRSSEERFSWAHALRITRELEQEGFNVLSDFKDDGEVFRYIDSCLSTYERWRYQRFTHKGARPELYTSRFVRMKE